MLRHEISLVIGVKEENRDCESPWASTGATPLRTGKSRFAMLMIFESAETQAAFNSFPKSSRSPDENRHRLPVECVFGGRSGPWARTCMWRGACWVVSSAETKSPRDEKRN